jgi:DNA-binding transcriptional regulator YiaG
MTQVVLAAAVGVTEVCVQLWERAQRTPGEQSWVQLQLALGPLGVVRETGTGTEAATETSNAA